MTITKDIELSSLQRITMMDRDGSGIVTHLRIKLKQSSLKTKAEYLVTHIESNEKVLLKRIIRRKTLL